MPSWLRPPSMRTLANSRDLGAFLLGESRESCKLGLNFYGEKFSDNSTRFAAGPEAGQEAGCPCGLSIRLVSVVAPGGGPDEGRPRARNRCGVRGRLVDRQNLQAIEGVHV